ncbi:flagellar basal-body rod protein FlgF [Erythrobacter litoralis]|jgi:flagellar basal-body rod protein FlgF|uniref:Flagellar basal-body rod protein FlgF n=1 Tax=Erythrobacter litoralis TaxID=39960 RepID=A0A074MDY6_9SPHN|nr:flagellar basal body rod protein FlgF [Erythrobacter litoralis]AOL22260.1 flagellar basal-body rod protein FlgF [Erythrobacter litoralis]KEO90990.1 flagellar basal-body rod protein FlgF [Erythrobacter litoralis]MEE4337414.1 flagellar basal body rod protein FlgF [Erythrobacter sp.]
MDRMIYTALTSMNAAMDRQRAVANNLANASTPGFRQELFAVTPATLKDGSIEARAMARGLVRGADLTTARVIPTGRPLDIAVQGNALIALQGPAGEVYSRRGDLSVAASGVLENGDGLPVLGEGGGPISVPAGFSIAVAGDGTILANDPAAPREPAQVLDRIKLVSPEGSQIAKGVDSFLKVPNGGVLPPDPTARVTPGSLEQSNVETAETLVQMIDAQRAFEQRAKIIRTANDLDEASSRLMGLR